MYKKTPTNEAPTPEPKTLETLSERVAHVLELRQMSRLRLEEEAQLARGYVTRIIKGERLKLSPDLLRRIADALRVSYEWLATGRGDMNDTSAPPYPVSPSKQPKLFALEAAIAYHRAKWPQPVLAAARAMAASPEAETLEPPEWADVLDQIEAALSKVKLKRRA